MGSKTPTMPNTIFFSWQADTKTRTGRNFIERALTPAASRISEDTEVEDAVREELTVDRDTMGVAGSPRSLIRYFGHEAAGRAGLCRPAAYLCVRLFEV